ncbi:MAG: DUF1501 domain-containing protein [Planctomycetota bacterium]|nr:DUF1501 domain-containing protein [Planctomycetota bacterium]
MTPDQTYRQTVSRRELFQNLGTGIGSIALASLLANDLPAAPATTNPLAPKPPHFAAKAKNVIFLHMVGAPSHLDLFENKPALQENDGQPCPDEFLVGQRFAFLRGHPKLLGTEFKFAKHGDAGVELSELLPNLATVADEICMIKSLHTEHFNHAPAQLFFQTGFGRFGRPTIGSWANYGLGSENQDLPGFVVLITGSVAGAGNSLRTPDLSGI